MRWVSGGSGRRPRRGGGRRGEDAGREGLDVVGVTGYPVSVGAYFLY